MQQRPATVGIVSDVGFLAGLGRPLRIEEKLMTTRAAVSECRCVAGGGRRAAEGSADLHRSGVAEGGRVP